MKSIAQRRTIRKYEDRPVSAELLNEIFTTAARASTTGNMQLYSVVVTTDPAEREALAPMHFGQPMVRTAPVVLTICADFRRFVRWCEVSGAEPGYDNFLSFTTAAIDALLFAQNVSTIAEEKGLGICYLGTTTYNAEAIIDLLSLPELVIPITTITLGYPAEQPEQQDRLAVEAFVHHGRYEDYTDERIRALYAYKESLESSKQFVCENGKASLAQVFTDVRYSRADNELISDRFFAALKRQGFMNSFDK